jgi:hypothetical protein
MVTYYALTLSRFAGLSSASAAVLATVGVGGINLFGRRTLSLLKSVLKNVRTKAKTLDRSKRVRFVPPAWPAKVESSFDGILTATPIKLKQNHKP